MSYSYFCKSKPFWVVEPEVGKRDTCLCATCENFTFLVKRLKFLNIMKESSPHEVVQSLTCENGKDECLERKCPDCSKKKITFLEFNEGGVTFYEKWVTKKVSLIVKKKGKNVSKNSKRYCGS